MNGADVLCDTLLACGIDACFANPGTSEMHFVAALDRRPAMRCILGLFEGVVTGAADGYARMADRPAATLLHTGPGLANGLANLHNARRARTPMVNVVGDHASHHLPFDAPLTSDIESLAGAMSDWVRRVAGPADVDGAARAAHAAAVRTPGIATLILPADAAWGSTPAVSAVPSPPVRRPSVPAARIAAVAAQLRGAHGRCGLLLSGPATRTDALDDAARIAGHVGAQLFTDMFVPRIARGRSRVPVRRIPYPVDQAVATLSECEILVLVGATAPVAFFGYPGKPSRLAREGALVPVLAAPGEDAADALAQLADHLGAGPRRSHSRATTLPDGAPSGPLTDESLTHIVASRIPEDAIVVDEALTSVRGLFERSAGAAPHDYLMACTGGAIGAGLPLATGAAVACPDRKVLALQADGSGLYTAQALWTQAREQLDVVTVVFANRAYAILQAEMRAVGVERFGRNAERMLRIDQPAVDWVALAAGLGVEATRVDTAERLIEVLDMALTRRGPFLIEAVL